MFSLVAWECPLAARGSERRSALSLIFLLQPRVMESFTQRYESYLCLRSEGNRRIRQQCATLGVAGGRILPDGPQTTMSKGFPRYVLLAHRLISSRQAFRATAPSGLRRRPARTLRPRLGRARRHPISRIWSPGWPPLSLPNPSKASVTASVAPCVQTPTPNLLPPRHPRLPRSPLGQRCSRKSRGLSQARSPSRAAPSQRLRLLCARDRARLPRGVLAPQRASPKPIPVARWPPSRRDVLWRCQRREPRGIPGCRIRSGDRRDVR